MFQFSSSSCLSRAIWLLFLNTTSTLDTFLADTYIPFNCEFLVAQKQRDHVVVLTEVHRVKASLPLQTYRFGHWTAHGGLICAPVGLYQRRNSLTGAVLKTAVKNVRWSVIIRMLVNFVLPALAVKQRPSWECHRYRWISKGLEGECPYFLIKMSELNFKAMKNNPIHMI
jgi:hypothetical protein